MEDLGSRIFPLSTDLFAMSRSLSNIVGYLPLVPSPFPNALLPSLCPTGVCVVGAGGDAPTLPTSSPCSPPPCTGVCVVGACRDPGHHDAPQL